MCNKCNIVPQVQISISIFLENNKLCKKIFKIKKILLFKTLFTKGVKIYNYVIYYIMPWLIPKILTLRQCRLLLKASGKHSEHKTHKSLSDILKHILKFWLLLRALACIVQTSALHQAPCFKLLHHIYPTQARDAQNVTQHCVYAKSLVRPTAGIQYFAIWINFLERQKNKYFSDKTNVTFLSSYYKFEN